MSNDKRTSIRIELTKEQQDQITSAWGQGVAAVELNVERLEERVAPLTMSYSTIGIEYKPQKPDGSGLLSA